MPIAAYIVVFCLLGHPVAAAYCALQCHQAEADRESAKHCSAKKSSSHEKRSSDEASRSLMSSVMICDHDVSIVTTVTDRQGLSPQDQTIDFFFASAHRHSAPAESTVRLGVDGHAPLASATLNLPLRI